MSSRNVIASLARLQHKLLITYQSFFSIAVIQTPRRSFLTKLLERQTHRHLLVSCLEKHVVDNHAN